jgi:SP family general alpha glucoside:H+ symporter-like MFS transporter
MLGNSATNITKGYDTIANGATIALPSFEIYFGNYDAALKVLYLPSIWTSLWSSMTGVGQIFGSAVAGPLSQKIGRRYTGIGFAAVTASLSIAVLCQF